MTDFLAAFGSAFLHRTISWGERGGRKGEGGRERERVRTGEERKRTDVLNHKL